MKNFKQKRTTMKHNESYRKLRLQKGFSLVELLIVIGIMGLLISVAIPSYTKYTSNATATAVKASLISIKNAYELCLLENSMANCRTNSELGISTEATITENMNLSLNGQCFKVEIKGTSGCITFRKTGDFGRMSTKKEITDLPVAGCSSNGHCFAF